MRVRALTAVPAAVTMTMSESIGAAAAQARVVDAQMRAAESPLGFAWPQVRIPSADRHPRRMSLVGADEPACVRTVEPFWAS